MSEMLKARRDTVTGRVQRRGAVIRTRRQPINASVDPNQLITPSSRSDAIVEGTVTVAYCSIPGKSAPERLNQWMLHSATDLVPHQEKLDGQSGQPDGEIHPGLRITWPESRG